MHNDSWYFEFQGILMSKTHPRPDEKYSEPEPAPATQAAGQPREASSALGWSDFPLPIADDTFEFGVPKNDGYQGQNYGDLLQLNTNRTIADAIDPVLLRRIAGDYLDLLGTSGAIYETNGDYALGIFSSGWCRFMDQSSRDLCDTEDDQAALDSGKWSCHESCWSTSRQSMDSRRPVDAACNGGIRLYAVPIVADGEVVGSINFGYGDPPTEQARLEALAGRFNVPVDRLREKSSGYAPRPPVIIELAKKRLQTAAMLIGEIVARKRAQDELGSLARELQRSNADLEQFAYAASHDLQEPLRAVSGYGSLLQHECGDDLGEKGTEYLGKLIHGAHRMQALIQDLLEYARVGTREHEHTRVDLTAVFTKVMDQLQSSLESRGAQIHCDALPTVTANKMHMTQLLQNLLGNAIKYCTADTPEAWISATEAADHWTITVRDNGIGIAPEYHERIFGIFQRLHTRADYEGTGMGLALCKRIVQRYGGELGVESAVGEGSTFYFTVPR